MLLMQRRKKKSNLFFWVDLEIRSKWTIYWKCLEISSFVFVSFFKWAQLFILINSQNWFQSINDKIYFFWLIQCLRKFPKFGETIFFKKKKIKISRSPELPKWFLRWVYCTYFFLQSVFAFGVVVGGGQRGCPTLNFFGAEEKMIDILWKLILQTPAPTPLKKKPAYYSVIK